MEVFYINICGFISRDKFFIPDPSTWFKVQLPISDSTEITAGGPKVTLEGPVTLDSP